MREGREVPEAPPEVKIVDTPGAGIPSNYVQVQAALRVESELTHMVQLALAATPEMQERIMQMVQKNQTHRHAYEMQEQQNAYNLQSKVQEMEFSLKSERARRIYVTDCVGKLFGFFITAGFLGVLVALVWVKNYEGVAALVGIAVVLLALIKGFIWLMGVNKSAE